MTPSVCGWELSFVLLRQVQRHAALEKVWGVVVEDLVARLANCLSKFLPVIPEDIISRPGQDLKVGFRRGRMCHDAYWVQLR